ncbi:MAG: PAS domain-containing protein, partial [Gemmatimonadetes bacterium]|nr:PAS domain-containing protein [Gemmatimonadota bacterium]
SGTDGGRHILVSFREEGPLAVAEPAKPQPELEQVLQHDLEQELSATRDELQGTIEELEASNEELKTSNEEVLSMNEELQSSNEELETSKEELQSLNEELSTVNSELQSKVEELETATNDLTNLLANTDIATIFLDTQLTLRSFTPPTNRLLDVLPTDVGRPIQHFAPKFTGADLVADAKAVLERSAPVENEVESVAGRWYLHRTLPYRAGDNRVDGVVVTFVDITEEKLAERNLRELNQTLEGRVERRTALLEQLRQVASAANEARTVEEALAVTLRHIAEYRNWTVGHAYLTSDDGEECVPTGVWYVRTGSDAGRFKASTLETRLRRGEGFAGRVLATGEALWVSDVQADARWRLDDGGLGLRAAVFFPVVGQAGVQAVLAFYSDEPFEHEPSFDALMAGVALQVAHVRERDHVARRVAQAAEDEQRHIGQELHDRLGQNLSGLGMLARSLQQKLDAPAPAPAATEEMAGLIRAIEDAKLELRLLAKSLIPLDIEAESFPAALEDLATRCAELYGIACRFEGDDRSGIPDRMTAMQLFRIAQEAVRNAAEHAKATQVTIRLLASDGQLTLEVHDDGAGFQSDAARSRGMGLRIMQHRASLVGATLDIDSTLGRGTVVRCVLPNA